MKLSKNIRVTEQEWLRYKVLKDDSGATMTRIFLKGLEQYERALKSRRKYAKENECVLSFIINKVNTRVDTIEPRRGWYQIVFIRNIEKKSLNTLRVHYLNYQFLDDRKEFKYKDFPIEKVSQELRNRFV